MKRSIAALGAAVVGLSGAVVAAAPAQAATTPDCTSTEQHELSVGDPSAGAFYFDCIPQYGTGKAEISIATSETAPFASDFTPFSAEWAATTSSLSDTALSAYAGETYTAGFGNVYRFGTGQTSQYYEADTGYPIASATKIATDQLPEACAAGDNPFDGAYKVSYEPVTFSFQTTDTAAMLVDDAPGKFLSESTPDPLYLGLNFDSESGFDGSASQCAAQGDLVELGLGSSGESANNWSNAIAAARTLEPLEELAGMSLISSGATVKLTTTSTIRYGTGKVSVSAGAGAGGLLSGSVAGTDFPVTEVPSSGKVTLAVSPKLAAGKRSLVVTYSGDETHAAQTKKTTFVVTKAPATTSLTLSKTKATKKSTRLTVTSTVKIPGVSEVATGKVAFSVNGKVVKTITLKKGKATGTLPKFTKAGTAKVVATYLGSGNFAKDASSTVKVTVK